jgi:hypothetical protein
MVAVPPKRTLSIHQIILNPTPLTLPSLSKQTCTLYLFPCTFS